MTKALIRAGASLAAAGVCMSCIHGPFANFEPIIDSPTPDERKLSQYFYAQFPNGTYDDGGSATPFAGESGVILYKGRQVEVVSPDKKDASKKFLVIPGGVDGTVDGGVVYSASNVRYAMKDGWAYCRNIEQHAANSSSAWTFQGVFALGGGLAGAVAGTKMITEGKATFGDFAVLGGSLVLIGAGVFGFQRSSSAAKASSTASNGFLASESDAAFAICMAARSQWVSDRQQANVQAQLAMVSYADRFFAAVGGTGNSADSGPCDGGDCSPATCDGGDCSPATCDGGDC